jgi:hypothetical protein
MAEDAVYYELVSGRTVGGGLCLAVVYRRASVARRFINCRRQFKVQTCLNRLRQHRKSG